MRPRTAVLILGLAVSSWAQTDVDHLDEEIADLSLRRESLVEELAALDSLIDALMEARLIAVASDIDPEPARYRLPKESNAFEGPSAQRFLRQLKSRTEVLVTGFSKGYFRVTLEGEAIYVPEVFFPSRLPEALAAIKEHGEAQDQVDAPRLAAERERRIEQMQAEGRAAEQAAAAEARATLAEKQRRKRARLVERFGDRIASDIIFGRVWVGMTSEMAIEARGRPSSRNRTVTSGGVREQWVYRGAAGTSTYLYFDADILTSYQD